MKPIVKIRYTRNVGLFNIPMVTKKMPKGNRELSNASDITFSDAYVHIFELDKDSCAYLVIPRQSLWVKGLCLMEKNYIGGSLPKTVKSKKVLKSTK